MDRKLGVLVQYAETAGSPVSTDGPPVSAMMPRTTDEILAHPYFEVARRAYVRAILDLYEHNPFLNRLLIEAGRSVAFFNVLCLHAAYDPNDRSTWPTMHALQETMRLYGISSSRRVHDIVARFMETGYVRSEVAPSDRRVRILTPTDKMLTHDRDWLVAWYTPLQLMFPSPGYGPPMDRDPAYQKAHRAIGLGMVGYAARLMADNPDVMLFMGREAGMMILIKLMQLVDGDHDRSQHVSFADIGKRFGISRTHVRMTLRDADCAGLVRMFDGSVALTPRIVASFDRFVADTMAGHDAMYKMAIERLNKTRALASPRSV